MTVRVGVVIDRIGLRIIVINGPWLVNDNTFRLVVGNVYDILVRRLDFDHAIFIADGLAFVTFQIAGRIGLVTK